MMFMKKPSHSWWFDSHNSPRRSPWLQSTLSELDEKTKAMLKLIEEDADSFAQRAEMYYKKRPELINMVEDFYRAHRSLAERFDQLKSESTTRLTTPSGSPLYNKYQSQKSRSPMEKSYYSCSVNFDSEDSSGESEVDDPEQQEESEVCGETEEEEEEVSSGVSDCEEMKLREETEFSSEVSDSEEMKLKEEIERLKEEMKLKEEIERLKEENRIQKEQLMEKDEEKREVIRQLSLALDIMKEENVNLKKCLTKESSSKKRNPFDLNILRGVFSGMLF